MKSVVKKVVSMAIVASFALVIGRSAIAADKDKQADKKEVKSQTKVVVVRADGESDVADALKKAIGKELEKLPKELREKIKKNLKIAKPYQPLKLRAVTAKKVISAKQTDKAPSKQMKVVVVRADGDKTDANREIEIEANVFVIDDDGNAKKVEIDGKHLITKHLDLRISKDDAQKAKGKASHPTHAVRIRASKNGKVGATKKMQIVTKAKKTAHAHAKAYAITVIADDDESASKDAAKNITVTVKDGKVIINGKPVVDLKEVTGKALHAKLEKAHKHHAHHAKDKTKPSARGKMIFMDDDGNVQEFEFDGVLSGAFGLSKALKDVPHGIMIRKHLERMAGQHGKPKVQVDGIQMDWSIAGPHGMHAAHMHADKSHADVTKRLKGIQSELTKIRKLLEKMQGDDDGHDH